MRKPAVIMALTLAALVASACGGGDDAPTGNVIAFQSELVADDGTSNFEVFLINADGSGLKQLTDDPGFDGSPSWSPDGTKFLFSSSRGEGDIWTMNADGSNQREIADGGSHFWSPDGDRFVFLGTIPGCTGPFGIGISVVNLDGSNQTSVACGGQLGRPIWSPDGSRIAYSGSDPTGLWVVNEDGTNPTRISQATLNPPVWSPDSTQLAFGVGTISVVDADGSNLTLLADESSHPAWSPDGRRIAFSSVRSGVTKDLYVMDSDGSNQTALTHYDAEPEPELRFINEISWSPKGEKIAFSMQLGGDQEIYVINADGSGLTQLTDNPGIDEAPAWSPLP